MSGQIKFTVGVFISLFVHFMLINLMSTLCIGLKIDRGRFSSVLFVCFIDSEAFPSPCNQRRIQNNFDNEVSLILRKVD